MTQPTENPYAQWQVRPEDNAHEGITIVCSQEAADKWARWFEGYDHRKWIVAAVEGPGSSHPVE